MMILRSSPPSPFGRKVQLAASVLGLDQRDQDREGRHRSMPATSLRQQNPLGKIPALMLEDGTTLFDSRVILEYLDHRAGGGKIIPHEPKARFAALRLQALCRRHDRCPDPAGLRRPLAAGREARAEMDRLSGRQDRARADGARSRAAGARCDARMSARSRSPARSAIAICASPATGARTIRACRLARRFARVPAFAATKPPG